MPRASISQEADKKMLQVKLKALAQEISSDLSALEPVESKELLSDFVSELFLAAAKENQRKERRQKQAEGIAAAKARGVRFGRTGKPIPDNFDEIYHAWREGTLSLRKAADACGLARGTFYGMAIRKEEAESYIG